MRLILAIDLPGTDPGELEHDDWRGNNTAEVAIDEAHLTRLNTDDSFYSMTLLAALPDGEGESYGEPIGTPGATGRGFPYVCFDDCYGKEASIQESSRAVIEGEGDPLGWIWFGIDDPEPKIMARDAEKLGMELAPDHERLEGQPTGWVRYPVPDEVSLTTRMHLNEMQVRGIVARLQHWLETGEILTGEELKAIQG